MENILNKRAIIRGDCVSLRHDKNVERFGQLATTVKNAKLNSLGAVHYILPKHVSPFMFYSFITS